MLRITIIGTGNVAWHLARGIKASIELELVEVIGRSPDKPDQFVDFQYSTTLFKRKNTDIILICLPDEVLGTYTKKLIDSDELIVHTSGSTPLSILNKINNYGVLYPLQTLTKERKITLDEIPFLIEANKPYNLNLLYKLARDLSKTVLKMNSEQRAQLHFAAVMTNNFSNHLLYLTQEYCKRYELPFDLLKPLVSETTNKAFDIGPYQAQTGPARRGDYKTLKKQLSKIDYSFLKKIYKNLTDSILNTYGRKKL